MLRILLLVAMANVATALAHADAVVISPISVVGVMDRLVYGSGGRVDGLILQDHTYVDFRPESLSDPSSLRYGDPLQIRGILVISRPNRDLSRVSIRKYGRLVLDDSKAGSESAVSNGRAQARSSPEKLRSIHFASRVLSVRSRPSGDLDRLVLEDGSVVAIPESGYIDAKNLQLGQLVSGQGVGSKHFIEAMEVEGANGRGLIGTRAGFGMQWQSRIGTIRQLLISPDGLAQGILLTDNSSIRFASIPPDSLVAFGKGAQVQGAGPAVANQLYTSRLFLTQQNLLMTLQTPRTQAAGEVPGARIFLQPRELRPLKDLARVQTVLRGPEREIDTIVLDDGATIAIPTTLRNQIPDSLRSGDVIAVRGRGGTYASGTAIEASSVQLANG